MTNQNEPVIPNGPTVRQVQRVAAKYADEHRAKTGRPLGEVPDICDELGHRFPKADYLELTGPAFDGLGWALRRIRPEDVQEVVDGILFGGFSGLTKDDKVGPEATERVLVRHLAWMAGVSDDELGEMRAQARKAVARAVNRAVWARP
ncbi:hypothetical protein [Micromonospora marina]|uniref:hypothetical protein n=1 Tax=Micromonospora marina TaxID=307120 RepID=UPI003D744922